MSDEPEPTLGALFDLGPQQFGLRGDVWVWQAMQERLSATPVPATEGEVVRILRDTFIALVGVDPYDAEEGDSVYREEFSHGGMSGGMVHLPWWRDKLFPLIVSRAQAG